MKRRLYFILPDVETSRKVVDELLLARIPIDDTHFLARRGTDLKDLPEATVAQKTDLVHGVQVGLFSGSITGAVTGLALYLGQGAIGAQLPLGVILIMFLVGALFGAVISGLLIGSSTPNVRLKRFQPALDDGHVLMMLDVPKERVREIREIIKRRHPESEDRDVDPTIPAFP